MAQSDALGRFGKEWLSLQAGSSADIFAAFGLPWPIDPLGEHFAAQLALIDLGVCSARIYAEPRLRRNPQKAQRDAMLERDTIHLAPTWRHADPDEPGIPAIILPVWTEFEHCRAMSLCWADADDFATAICDLIALPLDGSRPLSRTGHTLAVGSFAVERDRLKIHGGGIGWIRRYLARARTICADTPNHLVQRLHFPLPPLDDTTTLLVEPLALEWRVTAACCVIPHAAREVVICDSIILAEMIESLVRKKERCRPLPVVRSLKDGATV